jgi:hypothetical protein
MIPIMIAALLALPGAPADDAGGGFSESGFSEIRLEHVGKLYGNYRSGQIVSRMTGGVVMSILADDPTQNVDIEAQDVDFEYANETDTAPTAIRLRGDVVIHIQDSVIHSGAAFIDFETGEAEFTEQPRLDNPSVTNLQAEQIDVDLDTGDFVVLRGSIESMDPRASERKDP